MKQTRLVKMLVVGAACVTAVATTLAQETTTTTTSDSATGTTTTQATTTNSAGTIVTYTPNSDYFMFRTEANEAPVSYYYTKETTVVDPEGHTVAWSAVRPDMPATVYYAKTGDRTVVRKVVLKQPAGVIKKEETTTTTTTKH